MSTPLIINYTIIYFKEREKNHLGPPSTKAEWLTIFYYLAAIGAIRISIAWLTSISGYISSNIGIKMSNVLITAIFRKSLRYPALCSIEMNVGKLVNLI